MGKRKKVKRDATNAFGWAQTADYTVGAVEGPSNGLGLVQALDYAITTPPSPRDAWLRIHDRFFRDRFTTHGPDAALTSAIILVLARFCPRAPQTPAEALAIISAILGETEAEKAVRRVLGG